MLGLVVGIIGLIAAGCLVAYAVVLTVRWLKNKIKEKFQKKNVKKVAVADIQELVNNCDNSMSLKDLEDLTDEGYTHMMVDIGHDGNVVGDLEIIQDKNDSLDEDVEELLNRTKQGMLIVEG